MFYMLVQPRNSVFVDLAWVTVIMSSAKEVMFLPSSVCLLAGLLKNCRRILMTFLNGWNM